MERPVDVSVIVASHNTASFLDECLNSVQAQTGVRLELLVVDNASRDGSVELVRQKYPGVRLICNPTNVGFAHANNQAMRLARGEYFLLLNSDARLAPGALAAALHFMARHAEAGIVGPRLLNPDLTLQNSCRRFLSFRMALVHAALGKLWPRNPYSTRYLMLDWDHSSTRAVDWVSGACMLVRRSATHRVGLLDEGYFMYVEDVDWCWRMWAAGWRVFYLPEAVAIHHIGGSGGALRPGIVIAFHKSMWRYYQKRYRGTRKWHFRHIVLLGLILRCAAALTVRYARMLRQRLSNLAVPARRSVQIGGAP